VTNAEQLLSAYQMPYYGGVIFLCKVELFLDSGG